jgi:hypothetical protein
VHDITLMLEAAQQGDAGRVPTADGRELLLIRHTEPSTDVTLILEKLNLTLPSQPPPKIRSSSVKTSL